MYIDLFSISVSRQKLLVNDYTSFAKLTYWLFTCNFIAVTYLRLPFIAHLSSRSDFSRECAILTFAHNPRAICCGTKNLGYFDDYDRSYI